MKKVLLYFLLVLATISCIEDEKDPIEEPEKISEGSFKVSLAPGFDFLLKDIWIIIHDLDGKPLHYSTVTSDGTAEFDIDRQSRYHISVYTLHENYGSFITGVESYTNVKVTRDITLGLNRPVYIYKEPDGEFEVKFREEIYSAYVSSSYNTIQRLTNFPGVGLEMIVPYYQQEDRYLVAARNSQGQQKYSFISKAEKDNTYYMDFNSLKSYDKIIKLKNTDSENIEFSVSALKEFDGKFTKSFLVSTNHFKGPATEIAYLNEFKSYSTVVNYYPENGKVALNYKKIGGIPDTIEFPAVTEIPVHSNKITDFQTTMPLKAVYYYTSFVYPNLYTYPDPIITAGWIVHGNQSTFKLDLPEEIKSINPYLADLSNYKLASVYMWFSSYSYDEFIFDQLVEVPKLKTYTLSWANQGYLKN